MEDIRYIYQCVCQALALEEADVISKATRIANLKYIRQQLEAMVPEHERPAAEARANATVQAIRDRR